MTFLTKKVQKILPVVTKNWFQEWPNADKSCWQGVPCSGGRRENTHWYSETWTIHDSWFLPSEKDLLFVDMDIDTKPEDIKFESRATPNGELVYTEDPSKRVSWGLRSDAYHCGCLWWWSWWGEWWWWSWFQWRWASSASRTSTMGGSSSSTRWASLIGLDGKLEI